MMSLGRYDIITHSQTTMSNGIIITNSQLCTCHIGITNSKKLKCIILDQPKWHNGHTNFNKNLSSHSKVITHCYIIYYNHTHNKLAVDSNSIWTFFGDMFGHKRVTIWPYFCHETNLVRQPLI